MSDYRHWTSDEEKYIQDHWRLQTDGEMAAALDRSEGQVFCDNYCRWPRECPNQDELEDKHCDSCDLIRVLNLGL